MIAAADWVAVPLESVTLFVTSVVFAALLTVFFRRILGNRVGRGRAFIVSFILLSFFAPIGVALTEAAGFTDTESLSQNAGVAVLVLVIAFVWTLAAGLATLVILESIAPTGTVRSPLALARSLRAGSRRVRRYLQLGWIVLRSGLSGALRRGPGHPAFDQALVRTFECSGVTLVKLGQILSSRPDLIPASTTQALTKLQSDAAAVPTIQIQRQLSLEWGRDLTQVVDDFSAEPLAAASVAQVHTATLGGEPIVVKVQRPSAAKQVAVDGDIVTRFARTAESRFDWACEMGISDLATGLVKVLNEELDYRVEAANTVAGRSALAEHPLIVVPEINESLSTKRVLVMSKLSGREVADAVGDLSDVRRRELGDGLLTAALESILVHGVFHADLHPGNIMLLDDGRLGMLDFGAVGVLDSESRSLLAVLLLAIATDDAIAAASALRMLLDVPNDIDQRLLRRDLGRTMALMRHSHNLGAGVFADLFALLREYRIGVPGDVAGAFRTLMSLEATLRAFEPCSSLLERVREVIPTIMRKLSDRTVLAQQGLAEGLVAASVARRIPERVELIGRQLADGSLVAQANPLSDPADRRWLRSLVDDGISALFAGVLTIAAIVLAAAPDSPRLAGDITVNGAIAALVGFAAVVLALRLLIRVFAVGRSRGNDARAASERGEP